MSASTLLRFATRRATWALNSSVQPTGRSLSPLLRGALDGGRTVEGGLQLSRLVHSSTLKAAVQKRWTLAKRRSMPMTIGSLLRKNRKGEKIPAWWWWVGSLAAAVPAMALAQGSFYLAHYRMYYGDAPFPASPSRGLVMVQSNNNIGNEQDLSKHDQTWIYKRLGAHNATLSSPTDGNHNGTSTAEKGRTATWSWRWLFFWRKHENGGNDDLPAEERPLRLLVIGDSLAAGVGTSKSATPVLPEAIARSLSRALGGRAVYWTCYGTPGASAVDLLGLIHSVQESDRRDWDQVEQDLAALSRPLPYRVLASLLLSGDEVRFAFHRGRDWFQQRRQRKKLAREAKESPRVNLLPAFQADVTDFATTVLRKRGPPPSLQFDTPPAVVADDAQENTKNTLWNLLQTELTREIHRQRRHRAQARKRRNATAVEEEEDEEYNLGRYDVAVVMTGLNDLKQVVLPFMGTKTATHDESRDGLSFLENLRTATDSLLSNMMGGSLAPVGESASTLGMRGENEQKQQPAAQHAGSCAANLASVEDPFSSCDDGSAVSHPAAPMALSSSLSSSSKKSGPLVVLPALIIEALPMFQYPPFRWFALPMVKAIDEQKRELSSRYPHSVLYVEAPTGEMLTDMEEGRGPLWAQRSTDHVVLDLHNITAQARENMQRLMDEFYNRVTNARSGGTAPPEETTTTMKRPWKRRVGSHGHTRQAENGRASTENCTVDHQFVDGPLVGTAGARQQEQDEHDGDEVLTRRLHATMMMAAFDDMGYAKGNGQLDKGDCVSTTAIPGSKLLAVDNIHPNDEGYEMWGRHIAMAILQSWQEGLSPVRTSSKGRVAKRA